MGYFEVKGGKDEVRVVIQALITEFETDLRPVAGQNLPMLCLGHFDGIA